MSTSGMRMMIMSVLNRESAATGVSMPPPRDRSIWQPMLKKDWREKRTERGEQKAIEDTKRPNEPRLKGE